VLARYAGALKAITAEEKKPEPVAMSAVLRRRHASGELRRVLVVRIG
jgi:hypothetical protein